MGCSAPIRLDSLCAGCPGRSERHATQPLLELLGHPEEGSPPRGHVDELSRPRVVALASLVNLDLKAPEPPDLDPLPALSACAIDPKMVSTTNSISFFELCGVRRATTLTSYFPCRSENRESGQAVEKLSQLDV